MDARQDEPPRGLWTRWQRRRAERKADLEAVASARHELMRVGGDAEPSLEDTVMDEAGKFPPQA